MLILIPLWSFAIGGNVKQTKIVASVHQVYPTMTMTSENPANVKRVHLNIFKLWNGFSFINFIQICLQKPVKMALRPNLQQRGRSRHLICEFVAIYTVQNEPYRSIYTT